MQKTNAILLYESAQANISAVNHDIRLEEQMEAMKHSLKNLELREAERVAESRRGHDNNNNWFRGAANSTPKRQMAQQNRMVHFRDTRNQLRAVNTLNSHKGQNTNKTGVVNNLNPNLPTPTVHVEEKLDCAATEQEQKTLQPQIEQTTFQPYREQTTLQPQVEQTTIQPQREQTTLQPQKEQTTPQPQIEQQLDRRKPH
ncbi:myb-like protein I [Watersipora subatra]|uniref:myb-like protein I n=1 Tax=Watersipora subatra TaxID=2589382 RepID=UPI00355C0A99